MTEQKIITYKSVQKIRIILYNLKVKTSFIQHRFPPISSYKRAFQLLNIEYIKNNDFQLILNTSFDRSMKFIFSSFACSIIELQMSKIGIRDKIVI